MLKSVFLVLFGMVFAPTGKANLMIEGSRVIYDQARSEVDVRLQQVGTAPGVLQIWLDTGDGMARADEVDPPFLLAPVIARIEPGGMQRVRIVQSRDDLPADRETLLWFNVLETPLSSAGLRPGVRSRIKFFYRPSGLSSVPSDAHQALQFALEPAPDDAHDEMGAGHMQLRVKNPSPYHITFQQLTLQQGLDADALVLADFGPDAPGQRMVAPMGELVLRLTSHAQVLSLTQAAAVVFSVINDHGGISAGQQVLPGLGVARQAP